MVIYVLIKHYNNIDRDEVSLLCVSSSINPIFDVLRNELSKIGEKYCLKSNLVNYKSFTDLNNEHLIEFIIEERTLNNENLQKVS